jgi:hypothetical protein
MNTRLLRAYTRTAIEVQRCKSQKNNALGLHGVLAKNGSHAACHFFASLV